MTPVPERQNDESLDTDSLTSWDETQQRLESCGTHTYIEETGCLQNMRSAASFHARLERPTSLSGPMRTHFSALIHPAAPSLCLHSKESQDKPALPLSCARVTHALNVMSDLQKKTAGMGLIECSSEFEVAWNVADPAHNCERTGPYAVTDTDSHRTTGQTAPHTNQTSFRTAGSANGEKNSMSSGPHQSSSPAILHLPLHCQTQICGRAPWITNGAHQEGSVLSRDLGNTPDTVTDSHQNSTPQEQVSISPTTEERMAMPAIRSTDRAVFSDYTDVRTPPGSSLSPSAPLCHSTARQQRTRPGISLARSGVKHQAEPLSREPGEDVEEAWELLSPGGKEATSREGPLCEPHHSGPPGALLQSRRGDMDAFLKSEGSVGQEEDQVIEVEGWCHLPQFPTKAPRAKEKAKQVCWGLPEAEVRVWGAQILLALESLHQQGILCRDLNPKNILLTSNGEIIRK